ncbi:MAG: hypothetical protein UZ21_OP11001000789 [Microgenomates bacterium OLB22]|nr:MAG: hypothetical protein UZ21_OP11001000789 [Microgenomates bacterium OLB22]
MSGHRRSYSVHPVRAFFLLLCMGLLGWSFYYTHGKVHKLDWLPDHLYPHDIVYLNGTPALTLTLKSDRTFTIATRDIAGEHIRTAQMKVDGKYWMVAHSNMIGIKVMSATERIDITATSCLCDFDDVSVASQQGHTRNEVAFFKYMAYGLRVMLVLALLVSLLPWEGS